MRDLLAASLCLAALLALGRCEPAHAQAATAAPAPCHPLKFVEGWLRSEGYVLDDWGLMAGEEHQLWLGPRGWAILAVDPHKCARVLSLPDAPRDRLGGEGA